MNTKKKIQIKYLKSRKSKKINEEKCDYLNQWDCNVNLLKDFWDFEKKKRWKLIPKRGYQIEKIIVSRLEYYFFFI